MAHRQRVLLQDLQLISKYGLIRFGILRVEMVTVLERIPGPHAAQRASNLLSMCRAIETAQIAVCSSIRHGKSVHIASASYKEK